MDLVCIVHLNRAEVVFGEELLPITTYFADGDEISFEDRMEADAVVAGPTKNGSYVSIVVQDAIKVH